MDLTGGSTVNSLASPSEVGDLAPAFAKAVQDLPLCFHEGRDFPVFLRRLELFAPLKTGLRVHKLDQLWGFLDTAESLPLLAHDLLPAHLRSASSVSLASSLPTFPDRAAFAAALCCGDERLAHDAITHELDEWAEKEIHGQVVSKKGTIKILKKRGWEAVRAGMRRRETLEEVEVFEAAAELGMTPLQHTFTFARRSKRAWLS